jgi:hypothetical protein
VYQNVFEQFLADSLAKDGFANIFFKGLFFRPEHKSAQNLFQLDQQIQTTRSENIFWGDPQ